MGEMMDAVAHQWKQPLNALSLQADLLKEDFNNGEIDAEYIDTLTEDIFSQIQHMEMTLNEFRSFLRPNTEITRVKLIEIIQAVQLLLKDEFIQNAISINVNVDEKIELMVNQSEFKHIILNVLTNAKDAFNEKGITNRVIDIEATTTQDKMTLKICDNAGGMKPSVIRHVFEKGFTTKEAAEGTGIGLYISSQIIQKLGGEMSVSNTEDGACFLIQI
jgi:signal transduction histidine kinase